MKKITSKLLISSLHYPFGLTVSYPHFASHLFQLNMPPWKLADRLANSIHENWSKNGQYGSLAQVTLKGEIEQCEVEVKFEASSTGIYPEITFTFDLFYTQVNDTYLLGLIPVLDLQSTGTSLDELKKNAQDNIRLEFTRVRRLNHLPYLLITQWQEKVELEQIPVDHYLYSLQEVESLKQEKNEQVLVQVANTFSPADNELFGLNKELDQLTQAMKGKNRNSVLIIGGTGQGKTALVEAFYQNRRETGLEDLVIYMVTAGQLLHRLSGIGNWEESLADMCRELRDQQKVLYIPNFAELFEVGQYAGNDLSIADFLRPYVARGDISLLTECTPEQASQIELRSPGYLGLMQNIKIRQLDQAELREVVSKKAEHFAKRKGHSIQQDAVEEILRLQQWYTPYSGLPGKTIAFIEALATEKGKVDVNAIYQAFCQETGMPEFMINPQVPMTYEQIEQFFHSNIYGQEEAIETLTELLFAIKAAVIKRGQPLASLLFVGPTGVGKTEMAKVLAYFLFGDRDKMIRFDMSEYSDLGSVMRLTGDGHSGEGLLTATVRQNPFSVILFDELEKVHPSFYDLLLQILGEGRLTDAKGRVADFCSTIIIMTSNIGARAFQTGSVGFGDTREQQRDANEHFKKAVQTHFRPELFNRLDRIIAFAPLDRTVIRQIVDREIQLIRKREGVRGRKLNITFSSEALDYLGEKGYNALYGARHLQRTLRETLIIPLSNMLNDHDYHQPLDCLVDLDEKGLQIRLKKSDELALADRVVDKKGHVKFTDFLEEVSQARRQSRRVSQGRVFNRMMSQLDQFNRRLQKLKKRGKEAEFWQNQVRTKAYHQLTEMNQELMGAIEEVEKIESDNLMLLSSQGGDAGEQLASFQNWETRFKALKTRLVMWDTPTFGTCTVGIYGPMNFLNSLVKVYMDLGDKMQAQTKAYTIWFDKQAGSEDPHLKKWNPYFKEIIREQKEDEEDEEEQVPYYVCLPYPTSHPGDRYRQVGVEVVLSGELAYLYLAREFGVHIWKDKSNNRFKYQVAVQPGGLKDFKTPDGIHRQAYFSHARFRHGRREIRMGTSLKDTPYKIDRQGKDIAGILWTVLKRDFFLNLDNHLLG